MREREREDCTRWVIHLFSLNQWKTKFCAKKKHNCNEVTCNQIVGFIIP